jgi:hypothetical protein
MSVVFVVVDSKVVFLRHNPIQIFFLTKLKKGEKRERKQREQLVTLEEFSM